MKHYLNIYIQASHNDFPETEIEYTAYQGFNALGFKPVFFTDEQELADSQPNDLIVGRVSTILRKLESFDIPVSDYDYPEELSQFMGRKIWIDTLDSVIHDPEKWPVFVKPKRDKVFTGFVLRDANDIPNLHKAAENEPVFCSKLIQFQAEWRVFVRYGNVIAVKPYKGDWKVQYDSETIETMISCFKNAPAGYSMDVGVTESGETILVEINDGFALGTYGLDPIEYAKLLSARWCELVHIHDECDQYLEKIDWLKKRGPML